MKPNEMLNESIKFANNQLDSFIATKDLNDISTIVITALYRKIIELSEGVSVSAANGLEGPAELNYRGLVEAFLAFKYILQDSAKVDDRAKAYKVGYHKQQIAAVNQENLSEQGREFINKALNYHKQELDLEELQEVLLKFNELQSRDSRRFIPKWYSLDKGPKSINKLALRLAKESENQNLVSNLYGLLSIGAHIYMALNSVIKYGDDISIKPVRANVNFNSNQDKYNYVGTRSLLTSTIANFTKTKHPEYTHELGAFLNKIRPYLISN